jgi:hypothetical protein
MTPDQQNLLCYAAIQLVKVMARDLGRRAMKATLSRRAFASRDMRHLQKLCEYIFKVDRGMGELALKVVAENGPRAQERELLRAVRSTLGPEFFDKRYSAKDEPMKVTIIQEEAVCHCGTLIKDHKGNEGHQPVEMERPDED